MRPAVLALSVVLFPISAARADPPSSLPVDEIVRRATTVMDREPAHMVCRLETEVLAFDKHGKLEDTVRIEQEETRQGSKTDQKTLRVFKNGKDVTAEKAAKRKASGKDDGASKEEDEGEELHEPFSAKWSSRYQFALLRKEELWGRPTYVVQVTARDRMPNAANGTAWIDAEQFVELKGEYAPAKLPDHVDWLKFQLQFVLHPSGVALPSLVKIEGAGHFLTIKKGFRSTMRWQDCR